MKTTNNKHTRHNDFDIHGDLARVKAALADAVSDVKGKATQFFSDSIENAEDKRDEIRHTVKSYVTKKPFKAMGFAMLAGIAIGYILRK